MFFCTKQFFQEMIRTIFSLFGCIQFLCALFDKPCLARNPLLHGIVQYLLLTYMYTWISSGLYLTTVSSVWIVITVWSPASPPSHALKIFLPLLSMLGAWTPSSLTQYRRVNLPASVKEVGMKYILCRYLENLQNLNFLLFSLKIRHECD